MEPPTEGQGMDIKTWAEAHGYGDLYKQYENELLEIEEECEERIDTGPAGRTTSGSTPLQGITRER